MNNNQPDSQPNGGTGEEILPPNELPVLTPILPQTDIAFEDVDTVNKQYLTLDAPTQTAATPVCHVRMKFKDCGVCGNKYLFICPSKIALYSDDLLPDLLVLDVVITSVPNASKNVVDYNVRWQTNSLLPVSLSMDHLCIKFLKGDLEAMTKLREGRKMYDL